MTNGNGQSDDELNGNGGEYMTIEDGKPVEWWKSKKFTGYMVGDFTWKTIIFVCLYIIATSGGIMSGAWLTFMFAVVVTAGVAQMGFLGGQAWIDRYTQAIKIPATLGSAVVESAVDTMFQSHPMEGSQDGIPSQEGAKEGAKGELTEEEESNDEDQ